MSDKPAATENGGAPVPALSRSEHTGSDPLLRLIEQASPEQAEAVADKLARAIRECFDAGLVEIWSAETAGQPVHREAVCASSGMAPAPDDLLRQQYSEITGLRHGPIGECESAFRAWAEQAGVRHVLARPMIREGRAFGTVAIYTGEPLEGERQRLAYLYGSVAAVTLSDSRLLAANRKAIGQLQFLVEASQVLNSTLDLAHLLDLILNLACKETDADRGSVFLVDRDRREIWTILAHGLEQQEIRLSFGRGVAGHVAETGRAMSVPDAYRCAAFDSSFDEKFNYITRNLLCTPIRNRVGEIVGVIQVLNKKRGPFTEQDEEFLGTLSVHMALALENARLHRELLEKQRLERELQLARNIQRSLLPDAPPTVPGYEIGVLNEPCFEVGGDYYDFLTLGPHTLLLVIADVEGKGVGSAMVMSNLQATLRALVMHLHSLEVITLSLNEMILADTRSEKFLSAFLGLIDTRRRGLHYINAGHVPPLLVRADGSVIQLKDGGMVIGLFNAVEYTRGSMRLEPGDVLVCCTDGIIEATSVHDEEFGCDRLAQVVRMHRHLPADELVRAIAADVQMFAQGGGHTDDKVLMVVKVLDDLDPKA